MITLLLAQTGIFLLLLLWEQRMSLCRRVERKKGRVKVLRYILIFRSILLHYSDAVEEGDSDQYCSPIGPVLVAYIDQYYFAS